MTLKDALLVGYFFYHVLMLGSFVELTHLLMRNTVSARILMFLVTLFGRTRLDDGGFTDDGSRMVAGEVVSRQHEVTAFYTAQLIVIHHFLSFLSIMLAYAVFFYSRVAGGVRLKALIVLLLCASAFFASPYPVLSAPFLAIVHYRVILRRLVLSWAMPVVALAAGAVAAVLRPTSRARFRLLHVSPVLTGNYVVDRILGIPPFFLLVPLIEFGGIPFVLFFLFRRLGRTMRATICWAARLSSPSPTSWPTRPPAT